MQKKKFTNFEYKLPENIEFVDENKWLKMYFTNTKQLGIYDNNTKNKKTFNMQTDAACFEGWAVVLRAREKKNIMLGVDPEVRKKYDPSEIKKRHIKIHIR